MCIDGHRIGRYLRLGSIKILYILLDRPFKCFIDVAYRGLLVSCWPFIVSRALVLRDPFHRFAVKVFLRPTVLFGPDQNRSKLVEGIKYPYRDTNRRRTTDCLRTLIGCGRAIPMSPGLLRTGHLLLLFMVPHQSINAIDSLTFSH